MKYWITGAGVYRELRDDTPVSEGSFEVPQRPDETYDWVDGAWVKSARENLANKELRAAAYKDEADPLFFKWQRDEITKEEWLAKVAEIKQRHPRD
jgi:hypothetical protein